MPKLGTSRPSAVRRRAPFLIEYPRNIYPSGLSLSASRKKICFPYIRLGYSLQSAIFIFHHALPVENEQVLSSKKSAPHSWRTYCKKDLLRLGQNDRFSDEWLTFYSKPVERPEKTAIGNALAHPQFLHTALPQQRWRGRAKARGRAFAHAESGGNLLAKDRLLGFRNGMAGSWRYAGKEERSPPVNQRRATPLFRVREGPSPRLLRANVNGKNWGWAMGKACLTMFTGIDSILAVGNG